MIDQKVLDCQFCNQKMKEVKYERTPGWEETRWECECGAVIITTTTVVKRPRREEQ